LALGLPAAAAYRASIGQQSKLAKHMPGQSRFWGEHRSVKAKFIAQIFGPAVLMAGLIQPVAAQALRIGLSSEPTAIDPHYHELSPNNALAEHLFDSLTSVDEKGNFGPQLAVSWQNRDDDTWVFKLRQGVKFTNGQPFTADDVIFTFCRILNNEQSVSGSFTEPIKNMAKVEKEDEHTVVITTKKPEPLLISELSGIAILPQSLVKHDKLFFDPPKGCGITSPWPTVSQFNDGTNAVGTGPYKLKSYVKGSVIELVRNDDYWGEKPYWSEVKLAAVPSAGPRLAGLLAGDYDLIENPGSRDLARIKSDPKFAYVITPSTRVIFLQLDMRDESPFIKSDKGNPFKDQRVRLAVSKAIDRKAIVKRIMDDAAQPANQFLPDGMFGTLPNPPILDYDPTGAKKLLAEAGYPNGFEITFHATNDRYLNDGQIAQAVAQYLTQIGIKTNVDAMTRSIFFTRRAKREFSFSMGGWSSTSNEASNFLRQWVPTTTKDLGVGLSNYGGWSDPAFDKPLLEAIVTIDPSKREALLREAGKRALEQLPEIPLHFESTIWAFRKGITYPGRPDQYTLAMQVKPIN
jgi:peptide/nickel transport system substrate-binding protein